MANDMPADLDLEDLPPKALRKLIRQMLSKGCKAPSSATDEDTDKVDDERQKLSDMHAERKGKPPEIPVSEDDLPFEMDEQDESEDDGEDESDDGGDKPAKKMPPQFKKGKR